MKRLLGATFVALLLLSTASPARAVVLDTTAVVEIVVGIEITETTQLNFGILALNNGSVTLSTATPLGGPPFLDANALTVNSTDQTPGVFTIDSIQDAFVTIDVSGGTFNGLTLVSPTISIESSGEQTEAAFPYLHQLGAAQTTLTVGATLQVDTTNPAIATGAGQEIPYSITVAFN